MGEGDFRPSTARRPLDRFSWNLKYITTSQTRPRMQNFRGLCRRAWSGQIASLMKVSVLFWSLRHGHRSHLWTHPHAQYVIIRRSGQGSAFWGLERLNLKFYPFTPTNVKIGTLSWRTMENYSRSNSGTVSCIQFKLGIGIDHQSVITWHDSQVKRSKVKVTTSRNVSR